MPHSVRPVTALHDVLFASADRWPDASAIIHDETAISYRVLADRVLSHQQWLLGKGVSIGDRVAIVIPNVPEFTFLYYAISTVGAISVPLNPLLKGKEIEHALKDCGVSLLLVWESLESEASAAGKAAKVPVEIISKGHAEGVEGKDRRAVSERLGAEDTAVILYTSGTTGRPKGAELTHRSILSNSKAMVTEIDYGPGDVVLGCLPLFHVFGQVCALNGAIASGATLSLLTRFDPVLALEAIRRDRVTVVQGVPTMFSAMIGAAAAAGGDSLATVRVCVTGGASMPPATAQRFRDTFECEVREGYGLSETSSVVTFNSVYLPNHPGSIGRSIGGVETMIVDEEGAPQSAGSIGELLVKGPNVMKGYYGLPVETRTAFAGEWFRTGDLAYVDDEGYYFIVDRIKDVIIRGGYNVYPREVEEVLLEHPAIAEACVFGVQHDLLGEEVAAAVVVVAPTQEHELIEWVRSRIAAYKYPRHIRITESLPKGPTGKVLRRQLRLDEPSV